MTSENPAVALALRDGVARSAAVVGLAGVALIHLLDAPATFRNATYLGLLYMGLIGGCLIVAAAHVRGGGARTWLATAALPLGAIAGYTLSRTVGLPQSMDDIGNWAEPLGIASLFVEGSLVALAAMVLRDRVFLTGSAVASPA
jgi:hypothetical protein